MRTSISAAAILFAFSALFSSATTRYVSLTNPNSSPPYTNWDTAAHVIQDAIDAADPGDTVIVTNGLYNTGGRVVYGTHTNRVAITKSLTVQSVNGPDVTIIEGYQIPGITNGPGAIRCVYMTNNTTLIGFTITHGATDTNIDLVYDRDIGGVWCDNFTNSILSHCIIIANSTAGIGGGVTLGTLNDCLIASNSATIMAGGVYLSTLNRCTVKGNYASQQRAGVVGNWASDPNTYWTTINYCTLIGNSTLGTAGGASDELLNNCLIIGNQASDGGGAASCRLYNCTVVSNSAAAGAGVEYSTTVNSIVYYNNGPDIGPFVDGFYSCLATSPGFGVGNLLNEPLFSNPAAGDFHLQSDSPCINSGNNALLTYTNVDQGYWTSTITNDLDGNARVAGGTVDIGAYEFQGNIRYVNVSSTNPVPPYSDWSVAATNIQDAIDAANPGDTVLVTNGWYNTGGRVVYGALTNRVAITKSLTVQSVNGPNVTTIEGYQIPGTTNGPGAVRCVYMTNNTTLIGFTITHGATDTNGDDDEVIGGVWCANFTNSVLSNCIITANSASIQIGGVAGGTLNNCVIANNSDYWTAGASYDSTFNYCVITNNHSVMGAGAIWGNSGTSIPYPSTFLPTSANYCIIAGNSSGPGNAALHTTLLNHCLIDGNQGSGAIYCRLFSCTVVSNSIGITNSIAMNSIIYYNSNANFDLPGVGFNNCTTPHPTYSIGCITNQPLFVDAAHGDFHLLPNSPCINAGDNDFLTVTNNFWETNNFNFTYLTNDLDGNPRVAGGTVDIGAYEYQSPTSPISYAWLLQNGFPLDGSADNADPDGDGMNNYQEWRAGTDPTNSKSLLQMLPLSLSESGATLTWQSQTNINYYVQRATGLSAPFSTIQSNIAGQTGTTSYTDTNSVPNSSSFYRVGVQ